MSHFYSTAPRVGIGVLSPPGFQHRQPARILALTTGEWEGGYGCWHGLRPAHMSGRLLLG